MNLKKITKQILIVILAVIVIILTSCNGNSSSDSNSNSDSDNGEKADNKNSEVTITLPNSYFEGKTEEEIISEAKAQNITAVKNEDGSYNYTMPKSVHEKLLADMKKSIDENIQTVIDSDENSFTKITYNDDMTKLTFYVTSQVDYEANLTNDFAVFGITLSPLLYQQFNGVKEENIKLNTEIIDGTINKVFKTGVFPDDTNT